MWIFVFVYIGCIIYSFTKKVKKLESKLGNEKSTKINVGK
jgi:hypothetical protein